MTAREKGTHLVVGSYEYDRIVEPLFGEYPIEQMVIFRSDSPYSEMSELSDEFIEKVKNNVPREIETVTLDLYDFGEVFQKTLETFRKYSKEDAPIYLNISSAPKLALVAMISAAYFFREKADLEVFYVAPDRYLIPEILEGLEELDGNSEEALENLKSLRDEYSDGGIATGVKNYEVMPLFPIEKINDLDRRILEVLDERDLIGSISELVEELQNGGVEEVKRTSVQYRLKKLEEKGLITSSRVERRMQIEINRLGEIYLESYRGEEEEL